MTEGAKTEDMYLPVAYSGTMFFSSQNKKWYLPDHPPIGTTYTIASVANTATVYASNDATHQIVSVWGNTDATKDSLYLGDTTAITSTTVTATNAKTFIYVTDRIWQVIG
jgi:enamine deaminase RidA (YjgF/YER057c/UK114 family)